MGDAVAGAVAVAIAVAAGSWVGKYWELEFTCI